MGLLRLLNIFIRIIIWGIYLWFWLVPTCLTVVAIAIYFGLIYWIFDTVHVSEIMEYFGGNKWGYFFGFILPFSLPMFIAFISAFAQGKRAETSLQQAIRFRNSQIRIKPPKEASNILKQTSMLDVIENSDSDVMEKVKRGFQAEYGNSSVTNVFKRMMDDET